MLDPHREIQALVDNFVADLSQIAKRVAIEQLEVAFGTGAKLVAPPPAPPERAVGAERAVRPARAVRPGGAASPARTVRAARAVRTRRAQPEIEGLRDKLLAAIAEQPGRRAEDLNAALGTRTAQIAQPLRRLVADHLVRTEGARRGTRYFTAGPADSQNSRRAAMEAVASAESAELSPA